MSGFNIQFLTKSVHSSLVIDPKTSMSSFFKAFVERVDFRFRFNLLFACFVVVSDSSLLSISTIGASGKV